MTVEKLKLQGEFQITVRGPDGKLKHFQKGPNLITDVGENLVADLVDFAATPAEPQWVAFGDSAVAPTKLDTALDSEIAGSRNAALLSTVAANMLQLDFQITASGAWDLREVGIFNMAVGGDLFARFLSQAVDLTSGDVVDLTWILTFTGFN